jgi:hypothetical protein
MPGKRSHEEILGSEPEPNSVLIVLFIPSKTAKGKELPHGQDQSMWADAAGVTLTDQFGGCTEMPVAKGMWRNDDGEIIKESVILVHSYAQESHADDEEKMEELAKFLHRMGKQTQQTEIAVIIDGIFHRIRKFPKADRGKHG